MPVLPLLSLALAALPQPALKIEGDASARILWTRIVATEGNDWINDLVPLSGGDTLAVGFLNRVDSDAGAPSDWRALAATIRHDGSVRAQQEYGVGGGLDALWAAQIQPSGDRVLAGFTTRIGAKGINAYALFTAADGAQRAERAFGGDGYDRFTDIATARDGYLFLGHSEPADAPGHRRLFVVRTDGRGTPLWERIIAGPESLAALYIEPAVDGGFIVAGGIGSRDESDILVMKLDRDGRELWRQRVGAPGTSDVNHGLAVRPDGRIVVVGYSKSWGARDNDILAATLSPSGQILRRELFGGAGDDRPILLKLGNDGRAWIVGYTKSAGAGGWDMLITSLDPDGSFEGKALTIGGPADDNGTAILPLADGDLIAAGYSRGLGSDSEDAFVIRIARPEWTRANPAFSRRVVE